MKKYNFAIVGVTGLVGRTFLEVLEEYKLPIEKLYVFASARSAGSKITFDGQEIEVLELTETCFDGKGIDFALFSAGGSVSKKFGPIAASKGITVIDNSSAFRMDKDIPLVVPEVNGHILKGYKGIIANPNCSTIQAVVALKPLHDKYKIKRIVYSTYQSVSGAGKNGQEDLERTLRGEAPQKFLYPIADNCIPHIDVFDDNGDTYEELKMVNETRKILEDNDLRITATAVRVPVMKCHSEAINVEFFNPFEVKDVVDTLSKAEGVIVQDDVANNLYPLATVSAGTNEVYVGRIRRDLSVDNGLNLWVVAENIRKGAAANAVQIAKLIIENYL